MDAEGEQPRRTRAPRRAAGPPLTVHPADADTLEDGHKEKAHPAGGVGVEELEDVHAALRSRRTDTRTEGRTHTGEQGWEGPPLCAVATAGQQPLPPGTQLLPSLPTPYALCAGHPVRFHPLGFLRPQWLVLSVPPNARDNTHHRRLEVGGASAPSLMALTASPGLPLRPFGTSAFTRTFTTRKSNRVAPRPALPLAAGGLPVTATPSALSALPTRQLRHAPHPHPRPRQTKASSCSCAFAHAVPFDSVRSFKAQLRCRLI